MYVHDKVFTERHLVDQSRISEGDEHLISRDSIHFQANMKIINSASNYRYSGTSI